MSPHPSMPLARRRVSVERGPIVVNPDKLMKGFGPLAEVASRLGRSVRAIEMASAKLVKAGKLRYVGPQKGGHWEVAP